MTQDIQLTTAQSAEVTKLFELGAHLGHKKNRLHPQARKYLHSIMNGVSVIDLSKTITQLEDAVKFLTQQSQEGKQVLIVATKKTAASLTAPVAKENGLPAVTAKWMAGLLTNYETIMKNVKQMNDMKKAQANGDWEAFVKHERVKLQKDLVRLQRLYEGLDLLPRKPDILVVVDIRREKNAVEEARQSGIPVVALVDTNANPDTIDYPVVSNDDSPEVIAYFIKAFIQAIVEGKKAIKES